jgi:hypothetical protein
MQKKNGFDIDNVPFPDDPKKIVNTCATIKKGLDVEPGHASIIAGLFNPRLDETLIR